MFDTLHGFGRSLSNAEYLQLVVLFAALGTFLLYRSLYSLALWRLITDTPTQKIRSCSQGYAELVGRAVMLAGDEIRSPGGRRCVWFRTRLLNGPPPDEPRSGDALEYQGLGLDTSRYALRESDNLFGIVDETGLCIVDPEGARIFPSTRQRRLTLNGYSAIEEYILENDVVYVLGQFESPDVVGLSYDRRAEVAARIKHWKKTAYAELVAEFDDDGNGLLDESEWSVVRQKAEKEVAAEYRQRSFGKEVHLMRKASNGKPYVLAASRQENLLMKLAAEGMIKLVIGALSLVPAALLISSRF